MKKVVSLFVAAAFCMAASAESLQVLSCAGGIPGVDADEPQLMGLSISPNGQYICGVIEKGLGVFAADRLTGEVKWNVTLDDDRDGDQLRAIDDNGTAIGYLEHGVLYSFGTNKFTNLTPPRNYQYCIGEDITPDGSLMLGSLVSNSFLTDAAYSLDGQQWTLLPMPTAEQFAGLTDASKGSSAKAVSVDGKVILGHIGSFEAPVIWIKNEAGEYEPDFFMARFVKSSEADKDDPSKPLLSLSGFYKYLSGNGRYVVMLGLLPNDDPDMRQSVPVVYDIQNKEIKVYDELQEIDEYEVGLYPLAIADDGTFVGTVGEPSYGSTGSFIMRAGKTQAESFLSAFPVFAETFAEADENGFNNPSDISPDGRYIIGYIYYSEDFWDPDLDAYYVTYVIDLGEVSGAGEIISQQGSDTIYSIDGRALRSMTDGINIVRKADGSVTKILKK